jgi:translation elongation factor P/translation initiation factor 5A
MNADIDLMNTRTFHPLRVNRDAIHALALWLKANGSRQVRQVPDLRRVMSERYPVGLFTEDEVQALCELMSK